MNMREASKKVWSSNDTVEHINCGSLQRIADAAELMAKNHAALIAEKDQAVSARNYWRDEAERNARKISALRGVITKLKKEDK